MPQKSISRSPKKNSSAASSIVSGARKSSKKLISKSVRHIAKPCKKISIPPSVPRQWVIVQLSSVGEREKNLNLIVRAVHQILRRPLEVFIPAISQKVRDESEVMFYMEGYIFVEHVPDVQYQKLQDTTYFVSVLCQNIMVSGRRQQRYSLIQDDGLKSMRNGMQNLKIAAYAVGDRVKILKGSFKNLPGNVNVVYEDGQKVQVRTMLRSKPVLLDYPVTYLLRIVEDG